MVEPLTSTQKGTLAEAEVIAAALGLGVGVSTPFGEGSRYDLILDLHPRLLRVQCKCACRVSSVLAVRLHTCRHTSGGPVITTYTADQIDAVAIYSPETRQSYLIPIEEVLGRKVLYLRLKPTRNNQSLKVWWAKDHEMATAVARLRQP